MVTGTRPPPLQAMRRAARWRHRAVVGPQHRAVVAGLLLDLRLVDLEVIEDPVCAGSSGDSALPTSTASPRPGASPATTPRSPLGQPRPCGPRPRSVRRRSDGLGACRRPSAASRVVIITARGGRPGQRPAHARTSSAGCSAGRIRAEDVPPAAPPSPEVLDRLLLIMPRSATMHLRDAGQTRFDPPQGERRDVGGVAEARARSR